MPPKKKKRTRLPNSYGSICYLGSGRRRPYGVYPPATQRTEDGRTIRPKALGYAATYQEAMEILVMYHKGLALPDVPLVPKRGKTFAEVYTEFMEEKTGNLAKPLSDSTVRALRSAYLNAACLHEKEFASLVYDDFQGVMDSCPLKRGSISNLKSLFRQMAAFAEKHHITDRDETRHLEIRIPDDTESGIPFTEEEISLLWIHKSDPIIQAVLVMIYSGFRISAYKSLAVHLAPDWYFQGGIKTASGKDRIVPIHSGIQGIVSGLMAAQGGIFPTLPDAFRKNMVKRLKSIGIQTEHTPHDCRHTFSYLCEKYDVPENDRKRLLGHSFQDITNSVYGHRDLESLRKSIEMIQLPAEAK